MSAGLFTGRIRRGAPYVRAFAATVVGLALATSLGAAAGPAPTQQRATPLLGGRRTRCRHVQQGHRAALLRALRHLPPPGHRGSVQPPDLPRCPAVGSRHQAGDSEPVDAALEAGAGVRRPVHRRPAVARRPDRADRRMGRRRGARGGSRPPPRRCRTGSADGGSASRISSSKCPSPSCFRPTETTSSASSRSRSRLPRRGSWRASSSSRPSGAPVPRGPRTPESSTTPTCGSTRRRPPARSTRAIPNPASTT